LFSLGKRGKADRKGGSRKGANLLKNGLKLKEAGKGREIILRRKKRAHIPYVAECWKKNPGGLKERKYSKEVFYKAGTENSSGGKKDLRKRGKEKGKVILLKVSWKGPEEEVDLAKEKVIFFPGRGSSRTQGRKGGV